MIVPIVGLSRFVKSLSYPCSALLMPHFINYAYEYFVFQKAISYLLPSSLSNKQARPLMEVRYTYMCYIKY